MKNEKIEDKIGDIVLALLKVYEAFLYNDLNRKPTDKQPLRDMDECMLGMINHFVEAEDGLDDYCLAEIPLATQYGTNQWLYNSVKMYKSEILKKIQ